MSIELSETNCVIFKYPNPQLLTLVDTSVSYDRDDFLATPDECPNSIDYTFELYEDSGSLSNLPTFITVDGKGLNFFQEGLYKIKVTGSTILGDSSYEESIDLQIQVDVPVQEEDEEDYTPEAIPDPVTTSEDQEEIEVVEEPIVTSE